MRTAFRAARIELLGISHERETTEQGFAAAVAGGTHRTATPVDKPRSVEPTPWSSAPLRAGVAAVGVGH